jgi:hypothetical protein
MLGEFKLGTPISPAHSIFIDVTVWICPWICNECAYQTLNARLSSEEPAWRWDCNVCQANLSFF